MRAFYPATGAGVVLGPVVRVGVPRAIVRSEDDLASIVPEPDDRSQNVRGPDDCAEALSMRAPPAAATERRVHPEVAELHQYLYGIGRTPA
jgi:hypothetical protein